MRQIITTVGTSLFTNYQKDEVRYAYGREDYQSIDGSFKTVKELSGSAYYAIEYKPYVNEIRETIEDFWFGFKYSRYKKKDQSIDNASAEIKSIITIFDEAKNENSNEPIIAYLICTDTLLSVLAAELITKWFRQYRKDIEIRFQNDPNFVIADLRINSQTEYDKGFMNLINVIDKIAKEGDILNITGGYKAIIPILTLFGQIRKTPLKYIYDENEIGESDTDALVTVGNLPFDFDWLLVEAVKPFLKNYFFQKNELRIIGKLWHDKQLVFERNRFIVKKGVEETGISTMPTTLHQVVNSLVSYNLVYWSEEENQFKLNFLGQMVNKISGIGGEKGYIMELLLHKYFSQANKSLLFQDYSINNEQFSIQRYFLVENITTKTIVLLETKEKNTIEIGDIDVLLKKDDTYVLGESKAFNAACDYKNYIGKRGDYYFQLKARILAFLEKNDTPSVELLFIVFRFTVENVNDTDKYLDSNHFKEVLKHLQGLNHDNDFKGRANFRCVGLSIPISFEGNRIDFTDFYRGKFIKWKWKELRIDTKKNPETNEIIEILWEK